MKFKTFLLFFLIVIIPNAFSQESSFNYVSFLNDENSQMNKVSYEIVFNNEIHVGDRFAVDTYFNGKKQNTLCEKKLDFDKSTLFRKITCEVPKLGEGEYLFVGTISRDNQVIQQRVNKEYISDSSSASLDFKEENEKTIVSIKVQKNLTNKELVHYIPKTVLPKITKNNKAQLESSQDFRIIKEDPIIAWDLEATNSDEIQYKVQGKIDPKVKKEFTIKIQEKTKETKNLEYILIFAIVVVIILILSPLFKKSKK